MNVVSYAKGITTHTPLLDGRPVSFISSRISEEPEFEPLRIHENHGRSYIGSYVLGDGFLLTPHEAHHLIERDSRNRDCLFPYLVGEDLNNRPDQSPSRWVINFKDWPLEKAASYPDLLNIVRQKVKPERDNLKRDRRRESWWQYGESAPGLYKSIENFERILVRAQTSDTHAMCFVPNGFVYALMLVVFAYEDDFAFSVLQSNVHEIWLRRNASTMRTDTRYTPSDCFETFPFPTSLRSPSQEMAEQVGRKYHAHRKEVMLSRQLGLTRIHHLFHNRQNADADIAQLRSLHREMDEAIIQSYGWNDVGPDHGFYENERGQIRYTVSDFAKQQITRRLIELNVEAASGISAHQGLGTR